jgi:thioredoxin-like negative regulator of GroEL
MAATAAPVRPGAESVTPVAKPRLIYFHSSRSGHCRRVEGFLAQVLQRRRNHETFKLHRVEESERPELVRRFGVTTIPALVVVDGTGIRGRLDHPRSCRDIERFLADWLR